MNKTHNTGYGIVEECFYNNFKESFFFFLISFYVIQLFENILLPKIACYAYGSYFPKSGSSLMSKANVGNHAQRITERKRFKAQICCSKAQRTIAENRHGCK